MMLGGHIHFISEEISFIEFWVSVTANIGWIIARSMFGPLMIIKCQPKNNNKNHPQSMTEVVNLFIHLGMDTLSIVNYLLAWDLWDKIFIWRRLSEIKQKI